MKLFKRLYPNFSVKGLSIQLAFETTLLIGLWYLGSKILHDFNIHNGYLWTVTPAVCAALATYITIKLKAAITGPVETNCKKLFRIVGAFGWFCSKQNREILKKSKFDMQRDILEMRKQKRSECFILFVIVWQLTFTCGAIIYRRVFPFTGLLGKLLGR